MLDRALADAGVERSEVYVTNAVKHFRGAGRAARAAQGYNAGEIDACRWWLDQERALVRPRVIVALGASATRGVFGQAMPVMASRGRAFRWTRGRER